MKARPKTRLTAAETRDPEALLRGLLDIALDATRPETRLKHHLPAPPTGKTLVLGAGKASAAMAEALEKAWNGPLSGVITVPKGYERPLQAVQIRTASHPFPDQSSVEAGLEALEMARELGAGDLLIALISGGGSALWCAPNGVKLDEKRRIMRDLMAKGAPISALNAVRSALSRIKNGGLARAAAPARVVSLAVSDVPGDDPALIASGPTVFGEPKDAAKILQNWGVNGPESWPEAPRNTESETDYHLIATAEDALNAAESAAKAAGIDVERLGNALEGDAETVANEHAARIKSAPKDRPLLLLSGGELTVSPGNTAGKGGPNTHYALALAAVLDGAPGIHALAADTDGLDGCSGAAGAIIGPDTLRKAALKGRDIARALSGYDSASLFEALDDLVFTGPTGTNVSDFRAILLNHGFINRD